MSVRMESRDHKRRAAYGPDGKGTFYVCRSSCKKGFAPWDKPIEPSDHWDEVVVPTEAEAERLAIEWVRSES